MAAAFSRGPIPAEGGGTGPSASLVSQLSSSPPSPGIRRFGDYELVEEIARGGMGVVYKARQVSLNRTVAVKMILGGQLASAADVQRFRAEAESAAHLQHPNIVAIHEFGQQEEQHFFSMDYVEGKNLAEFVGRNYLSPKQAAKCLKPIAEAIQYAHERGILHRDLKPSNILIDQSGQPRITDFGVAKRMKSDSDLTMTGQVLGSPSFMPPEQASGRRGQVGPASDIYALGAILYYLLTARPPFRAESMAEILRLVVTAEPPSPRLLNPIVPRDLETICLKCLEKEPGRRYRTAGELAEELECFIADRPILARPASAVEKTWRWCRRKPAVAALSAAVVCLLLIVAGGSLLSALQIDRARARAEKNLARQYVANGARAEEESRLFEAVGWYAQALTLEQSDPAGAQMNRLRLGTALRQFPKLTQLLFIPQVSPNRQERTVYALSPDSSRVILASGTNGVRVWELAGGQPSTQPLLHLDRVESASFSPDGKLVATASWDSTVRIWDVTNGSPRSVPLRHPQPVMRAEFSPDGRRLVTATILCPNNIRLWDAATGVLLATLPTGTNGASYETVKFSPDSRFLLTTTHWKPDSVTVWSADTGQPVSPPIEPDGREVTRFSPDGQRLLLFGRTQGRVWDIETGRAVSPPISGQGANGVTDGNFSPDGLRVVTASGADESARVWDVATGKPVTPPLKHPQGVSRAAFSPDGRRVVTLCADGAARVWDASSGEPVTPALHHDRDVLEARFSADGAQLITRSDEEVRVWDLTSLPLVTSAVSLLAGAGERPGANPSQREVWHGAFSPDGRRMLMLNPNRPEMASVREARSGKPLTPPLLHENGVSPWFAVFSPDGQRVATCGGGTLRVWDAASGQPVTPPMASPSSGLGSMHIEFSADGRCLLTAGGFLAARVWDAQTGQPMTPPLGRPDPASNSAGVEHVYYGAFSPDGWSVATVMSQGAQLWEVSTGKPLTGAMQTGFGWQHASFSPDGRLLLLSGREGGALWKVASARTFGNSLRSLKPLTQAAFSPDGGRLVTAGTDRTARVWDSVSGVPITPMLKHNAPVSYAGFSPDGKFVLTAAGKIARLWDAASGQPVTGPLEHGADIVCCELSRDGGTIRTIDKQWTARFWDVSPERRPVEDVLALAQLVASRRVDATGDVGPLRPARAESLFHEVLDRVTAPLKTAHISLALPSGSPHEPLRGMWQKLRGKYPAEFTVSPAAVAVWHEREAAASEQAQQWFAARFHLGKLLEIKPGDGGLQKRREQADASLRRAAGFSERAPKE
jgi:WD40 repeat protein/tRNA A-37 threonylcarbamoyl transferase component Bud32